jgi:hypothetical protein
MRTIPAIVACAAITGFVACASADNVIFNGFSDTTGLTINGSAGTTVTPDGTVLRLTTASGGQAGSAFSSTLTDATNFSTYFQFRITNPGGAVFDNNDEAGADGLVFVVQSVDSTLGGSGLGIGYNGIGTSVGIEFDTWGNNANNDPSQSHVGIDLNGSVNHGTGAPYTANQTAPEFDDGDLWSAWIDYDGTTLEVRWATTSTRPAAAMLSRDLDIPTILSQDTAYIGFTSATGAAWENHDIVQWQYTPYTPVPEPASLGMLTLTMLALLRRRSRRA